MVGMMRQYELVECVKSYDPSADEDALNRAYVYAMRKHGSQTRASGDPYFSHPIEVAGILTKYKLDAASIITGLLHDTIEDTDATFDEIKTLFGEDVATLVDGVTKLTRIQLQSDQTKQAENFRKFVLAMSEDIRVLLVKLADRTHNMRTLKYITSPEKRRRIALETMEIYAPLAERIGLQEVKTELEDLAFTHLHPDARDSIMTRLSFLRDKGTELIDSIISELNEALERGGVKALISGREKTPYSIWRKMQRKDVGFEQLSDIMAFRILVDSMEECYQALGIIHSQFPMVPGRFKDYISTPKPNGYQCLHTGVIGPQRHRIEVQIRTREMHAVNELGVAAHWQYKQNHSHDGKRYRWLRELLEILDHTSSPEEFLENTRLEMYADQVFCFTPKGDLVSLPTGSTPVDFAYAVHTAVGDHCVGAKVNGRIVTLRTVLQNGDQVEIATSKTQHPSPEWERFVVTAKARTRIRRFIRTRQREQYLELGKQILERAFRQANMELSEKGLEGVLKQFKVGSIDDLRASIGEGLASGQEVVHAVYPELKTQPKPDSKKIAPISRQRTKPKPGARLPIKGLIPGMAIHFAQCCHPLPGDRIVGIVSTGKGVTVHTIDCHTLETLADEPERWLDISWDEDNQGDSHVGRVKLILNNETSALGTLTTLIAQNNGNIVNLKIQNRSKSFFEIIVDLEVRDARHLTNVIAALRAASVISSVERAQS